HRSAPDNIRMRLVWRGGDTSALDIPVAVGSLAALSRHAELEARILELAREGQGDAAIAAALTADGHRSPMRDRVLPSTVGASACGTVSCCSEASRTRAGCPGT